MGNQLPRIAASQRTLAMLEAVLADRGRSSVAAVARRAGLPVATAHRQVATLVDEGFLKPAGHGRHIAGLRLRGLLALVDDVQLVANVVAPLLQRLAAKFGGVAQMGTFDNDMVTYRVKTGAAAEALFTRVDMQLEAYCSGMGKVLLAHLPTAQREAYLRGGPFVALTDQTITDPAVLARELAEVATCGFARDRGEIAADLSCLAVPILRGPQEAIAAISLSRTGVPGRDDKAEARIIAALQDIAHRVEAVCFDR